MKHLFLFIILYFLPHFCNQLFAQGSGKWVCTPPQLIQPWYDTLASRLLVPNGASAVPPPFSTSGRAPYGSLGYCYWKDKFNDFYVHSGKIRGHIGANLNVFFYAAQTVGYKIPLNNWYAWNNVNLPTLGYASIPYHGLKGLTTIANNPGGRKGGVCWTDNNGYLWLFGGADNSGSYNDLWRYDITIHQWTWINGDSTTNHAPVYGTMGIAAPTNNPGGRDGCITDWVDANNNLWLFGGKVNNMGVGNDLWKYNIGTGLWTWVNGSNTLGNAGSYGTMGVAAPSNQPPARTGYAGAVAANGNLLLFGGDNRNDVWEYDIVSNLWTWVAGTNIIGDNGVYNSYCQVGLPAARTGWHAVALNPQSANVFYLFSGASDSLGNKPGNDLWLYDGTAHTFKWLSGRFNNRADSNGVWGTPGVWHSYNKVPPRTDYAMWCDGQNNLWIMGGRFCWGKLNQDMWKYTPDPFCVPIPPCTATYGVQQGSLCGVNDSFQLPRYEYAHTVGTYHDTLLNIGGCDSIITTIVTMHSPSYGALAAVVCSNHPYLLHNGVAADTTGIYADTTKNYVGCDSFITLHLTVHPVTYATLHSTICANQTYTLPNGQSTNLAGTYKDTLQNHFGCDSIITTVLAVHAINQRTINAAICSNQTYTLPNGQSTNIAGTYVDTLTNHFGCDSIITTVLTVHAINQRTINAAICSNQSYTLPNGQSIHTAGIYTDTLQNHFGCDSIITTVLTVHAINQSNVNAAICSNQTYALPNGQITHTAGIYTDTLQNHFGCDSIITTHLAVLAVSYFSQSATICSNQFFTLPNGQQVNTANQYSTIISNYTGCDSVVTTTLSINPLPIVDLGNDTNLCAGNVLVLNASSSTANSQYEWNDLSTNPVKTITNSGVYTIQITASPCAPVLDSIHIHFIDCSCDMLMPNAFSPNNDAKDDDIKPIYACDLQPLDYSYKIFNRWGQLVFQTTDYNTAWDGTFNGKPQPIATYVYFINWKNPSGDAHLKKGDVSLVR